ncbi:hypothetical protein CE91St44_23590 [Oscillospiraceae bacterium]|nr:hypothetical protein CE91St44_23590 [Oscillospiraceae bacterium]
MAAGAAHALGVEGDAGAGIGHGAFFTIFHGVYFLLFSGWNKEGAGCARLFKQYTMKAGRHTSPFWKKPARFLEADFKRKLKIKGIELKLFIKKINKINFYIDFCEK